MARPGTTSDREPISVLAWNLNHRIDERRIPESTLRAFELLDVDLILLNEFVDSPTRTRFRGQLAGLGYLYVLVSSTPGRHNQVLAASRLPIRSGDLRPPHLDGPSISNFLHVVLLDTEIELIGLRVPAYTRAPERLECWRQLTDVLRAGETRAIAVAGDFYIDPFKKPQ